MTPFRLAVANEMEDENQSAQLNNLYHNFQNTESGAFHVQLDEKTAITQLSGTVYLWF